MKNYLTSNEKLKKDGILAWSIPAFISKTGLRTCPSAGVCAKGCYARQGNFVRFPAVVDALEERLALSLSDSFVQVIDAELKRRAPRYVRIHAAGDFYSADYYSKWFEIIIRNPAIQFYAYTKQVLLFKQVNIPKNLILIFSRGGKQDAMILPTDRHSRVFDSIEELNAAGYVNASESDLLALQANHKIGLVYHGAKSKNAFNKAA